MDNNQDTSFCYKNKILLLKNEMKNINFFILYFSFHFLAIKSYFYNKN